MSEPEEGGARRSVTVWAQHSCRFLLNPKYFSHMIFNMCDILVQKCQKFSDVICCDVMWVFAKICEYQPPSHLRAVTPSHQISHVMSHLAHISSDPCHIKFWNHTNRCLEKYLELIFVWKVEFKRDFELTESWELQSSCCQDLGSRYQSTKQNKFTIYIVRWVGARTIGTFPHFMTEHDIMTWHI